MRREDGEVSPFTSFDGTPKRIQGNARSLNFPLLLERQHAWKASVNCPPTNQTHVCSSCGYVARDKTNLRKHMYTHTGEKPYVCQWCNYKTTQSSNLHTHTKRHHPEHASSLFTFPFLITAAHPLPSPSSSFTASQSTSAQRASIGQVSGHQTVEASRRASSPPRTEVATSDLHSYDSLVTNTRWNRELLDNRTEGQRATFTATGSSVFDKQSAIATVSLDASLLNDESDKS